MNARKWTTKTLATLVLFIAALVFVINVVIDPYGEFRIIEGSHNKLKLKAKKTTALEIASKLYDGKYSLIFGSSRTMMLSEELLGTPVLNLSTSIYNNPGDILAFLETLDQKQIANINQVYYLIDINSFHYTNSANELDSKTSLRLETLRNININKLEDAWKCLISNQKANTEQNNYIDENGVLRKEDSLYKDREVMFSSHYITDYYLVKFEKVTSFFKTHNINIKYYMIPWNVHFVKTQQEKLNSIINQIASKCQLYNYHLSTPITGNDNLFTDYSHLSKSGLKEFAPYLVSNNETHLVKRERKSEGKDKLNYLSLEMFEKTWKQAPHQELARALLDQKKILIEVFKNDTYKKIRKRIINEIFLLSRYDCLRTILKTGFPIHKHYDITSQAIQQAIMTATGDGVDTALLLGADPNAELYLGDSPLLLAARLSPNTEIVKKLLDMGANPNFINKNTTGYDYYNESVFTLALETPKLLKYLLARFPDNPLAQHAILMQKVSDNNYTRQELARLKEKHRKYYSAKKPILKRIQLLNPSKNYLTKENSKTIMHCGEKRFIITDNEALIFKELNIKNKASDIINKVFVYQEGRSPITQESDAKKITKIVATFNNMVSFLYNEKAVMIF